MYPSLCSGCLCAGRDLHFFKTVDCKQTYLRILKEIPVSLPENTPIALCWECRALLLRFTKFKEQVKQSFKALKEHHGKNINIEDLKRESKIQICHYPTVDIESDTVLYTIDNVKLEVEVFEEKVIQNSSHVNSKDDDEAIHDNFDVSPDDGQYDEKDSDDEFLLDKKVKLKKSKNTKKIKGEFPNAPEGEIPPHVTTYKLILLTPKEIDEERKLLASRSTYESAMLKCEKCIVSFVSADDLNEHNLTKHNTKDNKLTCVICECTFSSGISFKYHQKRHSHRYQCAFCPERTVSQHEATKHYDNCHSQYQPAKFYCKTCKIGFSEIDEFESHKEAHAIEEQTANGDTTLYSCDYCEKTFKWKTSLQKHIIGHKIQTGQKRRPYCEPCRLAFATRGNLNKHIKTSSKHLIQLKISKLKSSLSETNTTPDKREKCIEEIKNAINNSLTKFPCPHCDKKFQWKGNLLRHVQSHVACSSGQLVCVQCDKSFSSIATYQQHMNLSKKHVSERDFKFMCSECGKKFANKTLLRDHVDWEHLKNFVHKCTVCDKVFKSQSSLYVHATVVHKTCNREHLCDQCGKAFRHYAKLRMHSQAMHSTQQPFKCKLCPATFSWHSCLSRHVKVVHHKLKAKKKKRGRDGGEVE